MSYIPGDAPGDWMPTPPDFSPALGAGRGHVLPFTLTSGDQFLPPHRLS